MLLCVYTTWTLTKRIEKKLDSHYSRWLETILNKSWKQDPTKKQLHGHQSPISKTIQIRRTTHLGHCWRIKDKLISDVLLWIPSHGSTSVGKPSRTYLQQFCTDTGCALEDLPEAMDDRDEERERVREVHASSMTWWYYIYIYIYVCVCVCVCVCLCVLVDDRNKFVLYTSQITHFILISEHFMLFNYCLFTYFYQLTCIYECVSRLTIKISAFFYQLAL